MILQIPFPDIDPVFLEIGPLQLRWYGLMYMLAFVIGYFVIRRFAKRKKLGLTNDDLYDLLFYIILGVMVGGRLGYVVLYDLGAYLRDPLSIFAIWQGGMSFHGGFLGVVFATWWTTYRKGWNFWEIADVASVAVPVGLGLGRIGNFINGELFGRPTDLPWGMIFPEGGPIPRHPSQLYEAFLEGFVLFLIVAWVCRKNYYPGTAFWALTGFYGLFRFSIEFVREPDPHIGFVLDIFTRGQLLSLPMMVLGLALMVIFARQHLPQKSHPVRKSRVR